MSYLLEAFADLSCGAPSSCLFVFGSVAGLHSPGRVHNATLTLNVLSGYPGLIVVSVQCLRVG